MDLVLENPGEEENDMGLDLGEDLGPEANVVNSEREYCGGGRKTK